jgi:hypothetical protein
LFLAPVKFGSLVGVVEVGFFPVGLLDWIYGSWPPSLYPSLAGVALLAALVVCRRAVPVIWIWLLPGVWLLLLLGVTPGLLRTSEWDYALLFLWHLLGVFCTGAAVLWVLASEPGASRWCLTGLSLGLAWSSLSGWYQVKGGGLAQTAAYVEAMVQRDGRDLPGELKDRLRQTRAFGGFVYPNSYAAHLILTGPVLVLVLWRLGASFEPVRVSRVLFVGGGVVLVGGALWLSASRAAVLAAGAGVGVALWLAPELRRWRWPLATAGVAAVVLLCAILTAQRAGSKFASLESRLTYYRAAVGMFADHPLTGVGLGEFFPQYLRRKPPATEDSRDAHSLLLSVASQAGLVGGLCALLCLCVPFLLRPLCAWARQPVDAAMMTCVQAGLAAWSLHSLTDFDLQIPGTVATVAMLPLLTMASPCGNPDPQARPPRYEGRLRYGLLSLAALAVCGAWRLPGEYEYQLLYDGCQGRETALPWARQQAARVAGRLPWNPYPWFVLGRTAEGQGAWRLAAEAYQTALLRAPHRAAFHRRLAVCLLGVGETAAARESVRTALRWYPHDRETRALAVHLGVEVSPDCPRSSQGL